ncbi:hypothetical protein HKCCE2091_16605 [Rhodobacterales bacterium HKCCE2091]|nr:hypothetical protein [Rhodobacterales bacterium HKCCE2091]
MNQYKPPQAVSLFDLIARTWSLETEVRQVLLNADGSGAAAMLADGTLAFVATEDAEHPEKRMRLELETGRQTIRPREAALPTPQRSDGSVADAGVPLRRLGGRDFAFLHKSRTEIWRATPRGTVLRVAAAPGPVSAFCTLEGPGRVIDARGTRITAWSADKGKELQSVFLDHDVRQVAASADGTLLACWGPGHVTILSAETLEPRLSLDSEGDVSRLSWAPGNRWLAGGCEDKCILLVDVEAGTCDRLVDFPAPVADATFSGPARALLASGAFRAVGWALPDLPFGDHVGTPVESGRPGLTIVDHVAPHPGRPIAAVAYANGLVTICQVGQRDELMLREGSGSTVTALDWSTDGAHLAIGGADGTVSIVTFPKSMFK